MMTSFGRGFAVFSVAMMVVFGCAASAYAAVCTTTDEDKVRVVEVMRQIYVAATKDDLDGFHKVTATEFFAFDGVNGSTAMR